MTEKKKGGRIQVVNGDELVPLPSDLPGEVRIGAPKGVMPLGRTGMKHGFHSGDVVEVPTSLTCNVCPLYHVKRKDARHRLACKAGKKNQVCPILMERQVTWVAELMLEMKEATGSPPTASDRARIEQIVRHRSRLFQCENYLKVAGLLDLKTGSMRNVGERLNTVENALSRSLSEFRQAIAERREQKPQGPRLEEYLEVKDEGEGREE